MTVLVNHERQREVACLTLHRSERGNALSDDLVRALDHEIDVAIAAQARLIILRGAGSHFCTGFDLGGLEQMSDAELALRFVRIELLLQKLATAPALTACLVHGRAIGAGADLCVACDIRLCASDTSFSFPGAGFGLVLGTRRLAARVGADVASELVCTGRTVAAQEAQRVGLVNGLVYGSEQETLAILEARALRLDHSVAGAIRSQTRPIMHGDRDLASLVRSVAQTGLRDRIASHKRHALNKSLKRSDGVMAE